MSLGPASSQWFASSLLALLVAPYIHFNPTPPPVPGPGLLVSLGTGPIDMFSTRFVNMFTDDAKGTVAGNNVGYDGLKQALLAVQKHWDPTNAQFIQDPQQDATKAALTLDWCTQQGESNCQFNAEASVTQDGGQQKISFLVLDGDKSIFQS